MRSSLSSVVPAVKFLARIIYYVQLVYITLTKESCPCIVLAVSYCIIYCILVRA